MKHIPRVRPSAAVLAVALSAMALYACNQNGQQTGAQNTAAAPPALPLTTGAETAPVYAPSAVALPAAPRPKIVRVASQADQYAYVDQAATMGSALGSAPPDYGFDYGGVHPWVWRTGNNAARLIEPIEGGYRYYYYQPGAAEPYLIRDPQYAYGFDNGQLVVVYDARGQVLPPQYMDQRADYAGRSLARARALYNASLSSERRSVIAANWAARRAEIDAQQADWSRQQAQYSAWQAYHQQHDAEQQAYWQAERQHRDAEAHQFDQWHDAGYRGPPPPPPAYAPAAGAAGAALVGGAVGGYLANGHHHNDRSGAPSPAAPPFTPRSNSTLPANPPGAVNQAAQRQAAETARAEAKQAHQQQASQAAAQRQADAAAKAQARQQQAADASAQRQAQAASRAEAMQAHKQVAAQAAAQRQADAAAKAAQAHQQQAVRAAVKAQAHQQQAAQTAAQRQAQTQAQAQAQAAAKAAAAAQTKGRHPHPDGNRPPKDAKPQPQ